MPTTREASPCWDKLITTSWSSTATAISQHIGWYLRDESATWAIWPYPYWHGGGRQSHFTVWGRGYITWKVKPISHTPIDLPNRVVGITKSHIARKMNERPRESRVIDRAKNGPLIHQVMRLGVFFFVCDAASSREVPFTPFYCFRREALPLLPACYLQACGLRVFRSTHRSPPARSVDCGLVTEFYFVSCDQWSAVKSRLRLITSLLVCPQTSTLLLVQGRLSRAVVN